MAASSIHYIFTGSRDHLDESAKNTNELPRVSFAKVLKIRGCHEDGRQLESLHIYSAPWARRWDEKRAKKKSLSLKKLF